MRTNAGSPVCLNCFRIARLSDPNAGKRQVPTSLAYQDKSGVNPLLGAAGMLHAVLEIDDKVLS